MWRTRSATRIESGKSVLPVMIENCSLPLRITRMHVIDASAGYDRAVQQCVAELQRAGSGPGAGAKTEAASQLGPDAIATAKRQLTAIMGPIAGVIVDKAARRAATMAELRSIVIQHIEDPADRARFAAMEGNPPPAAAPLPTPSPAPNGGEPIDRTHVKKVEQALMPYLGPIAPLVAKRESRAAQSLEEFHRRVADLIHDQHDQAAFFRALKRE